MSSTQSSPIVSLFSRRRRKLILVVLLVGASVALWDSYMRTLASHGISISSLNSTRLPLNLPLSFPFARPNRPDSISVQKGTDHLEDPLSTNPSSPVPPNATQHPIVNGLLEVDMTLPSSKHPIYQLIENAKEEWHLKLSKQSKTLGEAVEEYKRRNEGRPPPKGFDKWWDYVQKHNVILPDEYNLIMHDLKYYFGYSPQYLRELVKDMTSWKDTYVLSVRDGKAQVDTKNVDFDRIGGSEDRVKGQLSHIEEVSKWIPDFDAVLNIHDTPLSFVSSVHKWNLQELVDDGEFWDSEEEADRSFSTWGAACPSNSPLHLVHPKLHTDASSLNINLTLLNVPYTPPEIFTNPREKSFISSHVHNMNLCLHPDIIKIHGSTSGVNPHPQARMYPIFSLSRTGMHSDALVIPTEQWGEKEEHDVIPWEKKKSDHLLWRGRNTGGYYTDTTPWRSFQRSRLASLGSSHIKEEIAVLAAPPRVPNDLPLEETVQMIPEGWLNDRLMDLGLAYEPVQCSHEDGTCQEITEVLTFRTVRTFDDEVHFRYILDVDGNAWSARFKRLLSTGSLILKSTIFPEFWNDRIQPWLHYVPVKVDYSDMYDIMTFFRGDTSNPGEDRLAKEIATKGRQWSVDNWRREDMTAYMFRLWLEWARLMAHDRSTMNFNYGEEDASE